MCGHCSSCSGCSGAPPANVDTMRHGNFAYEVRGDDYAATVQHGALDLVPLPRPSNARANQAEGGSPSTTSQGIAFHRFAGRVVRQMEPLYNAAKFAGHVGVTLVRNAKNIPLVYDAGYDGILPLTQQPKIDKPLPYAR